MGQEELQIVNSRNNVLQVQKGNETWFLVYGIIDLFATKDSKKWWQSHTYDRNWIFGNMKFALYPVYTFCMSQFFLYYTKFTGKLNENASTSWEHQIGMSWPQCFNKGGLLDKRHEIDTNGAVHGSEDTAHLHDAIRYDDRICSLMQTCDAVLHKEHIANNLFNCCSVANEGKECDMW